MSVRSMTRRDFLKVAGVTVGVAADIGETLSRRGFAVDVKPCRENPPVALYCVHAMNLGDDEKSRKNRLAYLDAVRPLLHSVAEVYFAGVGPDPAKTSWFERWLYRAFNGGAEGDCRDWNKIRGWAESVAI